MEKTNFTIKDKTYEFSLKDSPGFKYGKSELLSRSETDITFSQDWYKEGYKAVKFMNDEEFDHLREGMTKCVRNIINQELGIKVDNFELSNYHNIVKSDEDHFKVVSKTRDLYPEDFNFPVTEIFPTFEKILGFKLTDIEPDTNTKLHIIVRINRPFSKDYNPPHKDIYEHVDKKSYIPQFLNLWIPISGVTQNSSLPVAPSSHLLPEDKILRTFEGGVIEGNKYRVRMIKEWGGSNKLMRPVVNYGEVLFFTSHLIHGLAINEENNTTRVALEFRLFKKN